MGQLGIHTQHKLLEPYLTPYTNINSKWVRDLNGTIKTIKLLGEYFVTLGQRSFLVYDSKNSPQKRKLVSWMSSKLKLLLFRRYHEENYKTWHILGENMCISSV